MLLRQQNRRNKHAYQIRIEINSIKESARGLQPLQDGDELPDILVEAIKKGVAAVFELKMHNP